MTDEEKKAIEYFERKIKNKLPLYVETYVDGKPYRRNILQIETNFTEEQANKTQTILNLISKLQKENEKQKRLINKFAERLESKSKWMTREKWKIVLSKELEREIEDEKNKNV